MRAIIQRVSKASVVVDQSKIASINQGLLVLLGVESADTEEDATWLAAKICALRIFSDAEGKMNLDLQMIQGDVILVSQFTLHAKTKKGTRPSFIRAADPASADKLYRFTADEISRINGKSCQTGKFGAHMEVELSNDGPVTIFIDTKEKD